MHVYAVVLLQMMQELQARIQLFVVGLTAVKHYGYAATYYILSEAYSFEVLTTVSFRMP